MSKRKIYISKDRKNFFWIVVDRQKLILNTTEEDDKFYTTKELCTNDMIDQNKVRTLLNDDLRQMI